MVDEEALERFLDERLPGPGRVEVERHRAGHSNETFFVRRGAEEWVLRRPPRGAFLPTAHDVMREFRVLSALAGTGVRAPRPVLACEDDSVIGAPFYLMERVPGVVIRDELPPAFADGPAGARRGIGEELVDALAELHAADFRAVGLEGWGRPAGYLERQVRRWQGQLAMATMYSRPLPELVAVGQWLAEHVPGSSDSAIVHGDYKLDNVAFRPEPPAHLEAIFDWEMSTLGDPLADVGWMISFWAEPDDPADLSLERGTVTRLPGFSARPELLDRYSQRTGRSTGDLLFHTVLAVWKLAVLLEGSYARHLAGVTDDPFFAELEEGVPALAHRARELIDAG
ncbi:MAG: phosphotransferase family protein [Actinobacteria bacterium]|nr:phosphotransferase family protein [Actinomycetota bacterium]